MPPPTTLAAAWGKTPSSNPCLGVPSTQSSARPREAPHIWAGLQRVQRRGGMSGLRHKCNQPLGPWEEERARREPFRRCEKRQETRRSAAGVWRRLRKGRRAEGERDSPFPCLDRIGGQCPDRPGDAGCTGCRRERGRQMLGLLTPGGRQASLSAGLQLDRHHPWLHPHRLREMQAVFDPRA